MVLWATECAEHVLPYVEENYPSDNRPRKALEVGRAWVRGEVAVSEVRAAALAAHTAARDADGRVRVKLGSSCADRNESTSVS